MLTNIENIAIVIPARGSSKGIPKKNMRMLGKKPLIAYPIENALKVKRILSEVGIDIALTTEDLYIREYVEKLYDEIFFIERGGSLSEDSIPLDPVVYDAVSKLEKKLGKEYEMIITMLPTTPLLSVNTIINTIKIFTEKNDEVDSSVLVNELRHIFWEFDAKKNAYGLITERKNRQYLKPIFEETGGIVITKRNYSVKND